MVKEIVFWCVHYLSWNAQPETSLSHSENQKDTIIVTQTGIAQNTFLQIHASASNGDFFAVTTDGCGKAFPKYRIERRTNGKWQERKGVYDNSDAYCAQFEIETTYESAFSFAVPIITKGEHRLAIRRAVIGYHILCYRGSDGEADIRWDTTYADWYSEPFFIR